MAQLLLACRYPRTHGKHRNPDNPDQILESAAAQKIRDCRNTHRRNRQVAFLPACMSTSWRIHGEFLRLLFFLANKKADDYFESLGYQPHKQEVCHRRSVFFQQHWCTIGMTCDQVGVTWRSHHCASPRRCTTQPAASQHGLRRIRQRRAPRERRRQGRVVLIY